MGDSADTGQYYLDQKRKRKVRVKKGKKPGLYSSTSGDHSYDVPVPKAYTPPKPKSGGGGLFGFHTPGLDSLRHVIDEAEKSGKRAAHYIDKAEHRSNVDMKKQFKGENKPGRGWGGLLSDLGGDAWGKLEKSVEGPAKKPLPPRSPRSLIPYATFATTPKSKPMSKDEQLALALDVAIGREPSFGASAKATKPNHGLPQFLETISGQPYGERAFQNDLGDRDYSNPWDYVNALSLFPLGRPIKGIAAGGAAIKAAAKGEKAVEAAKTYYGAEGIASRGVKKAIGLKPGYRLIWHPDQKRWVPSKIPTYTTRTGRAAEKVTEQIRKAVGTSKFVPMKSGTAKLAQEELRTSRTTLDALRTYRARRIGTLGRKVQHENPVEHYALRVLSVNRGPEQQAKYYRRQAELARKAGDEASAIDLTAHAAAFDEVADRHLVHQDKEGHWHLNKANVSPDLKAIDKLWGQNAAMREAGLIDMGILDAETILRRIDAPAAEIDHALSGLRESPDRARVYQSLVGIDSTQADNWIKLFDARSLHEAEETRLVMDEIYKQQKHLKDTGQAYDEKVLDLTAKYRVFGVPNDIWYTKLTALNSDWTTADLEAIKRKHNLADIIDLMEKNHTGKDAEGNRFRFSDESVNTAQEDAWWAENGDWAFRIPFLIDRKDPTFVMVGAPGDIHGDLMPPDSHWNEWFQGQILVDGDGTRGPGHEILHVSYGDENKPLNGLQKRQIRNQVDRSYQSWREHRFPVEDTSFKFEGAPLASVGRKAPKNLKAKVNPGRRAYAPQNARIRRSGMQITGPVSPKATITRILKVMPTKKERQYWAKWYEHFEPVFRAAFGDDADAIMRGFALSQANTSPAGGLGAVLKVMERLRNGEEVTSEGIGMIADAVHQAILNSPLEKGAAAKLSDFQDALALSKTRGWMGHAVEGGMPAPVDIWAARARGWVDKKFAKKLKEVYDIDATIDLPGAPSGARYEQMAEEYQVLANHFNKVRFDGRGNWTPAQVQALDWAVIQKTVGVDPEDLQYALDRNSYEMAFEFTQGVEGFGNDLTIEEAKAVGRLMEKHIRDIVADTDGVYMVPGTEIDYTTGGWSGGQNAAAQFKVVGEAGAVGRLVQRLAIAFDQEWVQAARVTSSASHAPRSALVIESKDFEDEAVKQAFFERLNQLSPQSKNPGTNKVEDDIQGYMKGEGNSIVIRTHRGTATGKGAEKFMNRYQKVVDQAASDVGIEAHLSPRNVALITGGADGVENPLLTARGISQPPLAGVDDQLALDARHDLEVYIDSVRADAGRAKPAFDPVAAEGKQAEFDKNRIINRVIEENGWPRGNESEGYVDQFLKENPDFEPGWEDVWNRAEQHKQSQYPEWARGADGADQHGVQPFDGGLLYTGDDGSLGIRFTGDSERGAADSAPGYDPGFERQDQLDVADMLNGPGGTQFSLQYDEAFPGEPPVSSDAEDAVQQFNEFIRREQRLDETPDETESRLLREAAAAMAENDRPRIPNSLSADPEGSTPGDIGTFQWAQGLLGPNNARKVAEHRMSEDDIHALLDTVYHSPNIPDGEAMELVDWVNRVNPPEGARHEQGGFQPPVSEEVIDPRAPGLTFDDAFPEEEPLPDTRWVEGILGGTVVSRITTGAFNNDEGLQRSLRYLVDTAAHDHGLSEQEANGLHRWVDSHVQGYVSSPAEARGAEINPERTYRDPEGSRPGDFGTRMWADNLIGQHIVNTLLNGSLHPQEATRLIGLRRADNSISAVEEDQLNQWVRNQTERMYPPTKTESAAKKSKRPTYRVEEVKDGQEYWQYYGEKSTYHAGFYGSDDDHVIFNLFDDDTGEMVGSINASLRQPHTDWTGKQVPAHLEVSELFIQGNSRERAYASHADEAYDEATGRYMPRRHENDYRKDIGAFMALVKPITEVAEEWKLPIHADFANAALSKIAQKWSKRAGRSDWIPEDLRQAGYFADEPKKKGGGYIHGLHSRKPGEEGASVSISGRTPIKNLTIAHEVIGHFDQLVSGLNPGFDEALRKHGYLPPGSLEDLSEAEAADYVEKFAKLAENWAFHGGEGLPPRVREAYEALTTKVRQEIKDERWGNPKGKRTRQKPVKLKRGQEELYSYFDDMFAWEDAVRGGGRYAPETRASAVSLRKSFEALRRTEGQARAYHSTGAMTLLGNDPSTKHRFAAKLMRSGYFTGEITKGIRRSGMKMAKLMSFADIRKAALKIATERPTLDTDIPIRDNITHGFRRSGENSKQINQALDILRSMEIDERKIDVSELDNLPPEVLQEMADFIAPSHISGTPAIEVARKLIDGATQPIPNIKWISREAAEEFGLMDAGVTKLGKGAWAAEAAGKFADSLNAWARLQILYLNPAYYPMNFIGNGVMNLMQQGVFYLPNTKMAAYLSRELGEDKAAMVDLIMGTGLSESIGFRETGPDAVIRNAMNNFATRLVDTIPRRAAFIHEARRMGYDDSWKITALLDAADQGDQEAKDVLDVISRRAKDAIVDYDRLNSFEKNVMSRLIFFYPWIKGATRWTAQFPLNHPVQATAFAAALAAQQYYADKDIGDRPWYLDLDVPLPFHNARGDQYTWNPRQAFTFTTPWDLAKTAIEFTPGLKDVVPGQGQPLAEMLAPVPGAGLVALAGKRSFDQQDVPQDFGTLYNEYASLPPIVSKLYGLFGPTDSNFHGLRGPASDDSNFLYHRNDFDKATAIIFGGLAPKPLNKDKANWLGQGQRGTSPQNKWENWEKEFKATFKEDPSPALRQAINSKIEWETMKDRGAPDQEDFPDGTKTISEERLQKKIALAIRYDPSLRSRRAEMIQDAKKGYQWRRNIDSFLERAMGWSALSGVSEDINARQRAANQ